MTPPELTDLRVVNAIPAHIWRSAPDGAVQFVNQQWMDYTGLSQEHSQGWGWVSVIHPDDRPGLIETWQRVLEAGRPKEAEARFRRLDGEYRWYLIRMVPIRDESGAAVRGAEQQFLNIGLPITLKVRRVIVSGDIALLISDWTLSGKAADGSDVNMSGTTADVARRGPDGWKYVIDNPFGTV